MNFLPCTVQILVVPALMELEFIGMLGVTKAIDEKDLRALMETNFWAALHLTREVVVAFLTTEKASRNLKGVSEVRRYCMDWSSSLAHCKK